MKPLSPERWTVVHGFGRLSKPMSGLIRKVQGVGVGRVFGQAATQRVPPASTVRLLATTPVRPMGICLRKSQRRIRHGGGSILVEGRYEFVVD
jgi:hypothetical protein